MPTRILIQLAEAAATAAAVPPAVQRLLDEAGAGPARPSHAELRGLYTALVPDGASAPALIARLRGLGEVRYAELDAPRGTV